MNVNKVENLKHVDLTRYKEGDVFVSPKQIGIIQNGKMEILIRQSDLKDYVKKKDVQALIDNTMKKVERK